MSQRYKEHPAVQKMKAQGVPVIPVALYLDATEYAKRDSMLVLTCTNLLSERKHVICVLRKRLMCGAKAGCGCKGWCSLYPLWLFVQWSLEALGDAVYPVARHNTKLDGLKPEARVWRAEDKQGAEKAGFPMPAAAAVVQIRVDWAEMSSRLGLANWSTASDPCFLCHCSQDDMYEKDKLAAREPMPWPLRTADGYDQACEDCEIQVPIGQLSREEWAKFTSCLENDLRKDGSRGLALTQPWPPLGLRKGDRVEPCPAMPDWQMLYKEKPESMLFWRPMDETSVRHRNPLFSEGLGTSIDQAYSVDVMHAWCLGIFQQFVVHALWQVLEGELFDTSGGVKGAKENKLQKAVVKLNSRLSTWYKEFSSKHPLVVLTRVQDFGLSRLGTSTKPVLHCKAHETLGLVRYLADVLPGWQEKIANGAAWAKGARRLLRMWSLVSESPVDVPEATQKARPVERDRKSRRKVSKP